ncbi:hypothetical protein ACF3OF_02000 [Sneathia vaginalis]|jgi:hypothetical protein
MLGSVNSKDKKIEELTKQNNIFAENIRKQNERIQKLEDIVKRLMNK